MGLSNILNLNTTPIISVDAFLEQKPDGIITVKKLEKKKVRDRDGNPTETIVYTIKELGGIRLWSSGKTMSKIIPEELIDEYGSLEEANEALKDCGLRLKLSPMKIIPKKGQWRPVDGLGYEEDSDGKV